MAPQIMNATGRRQPPEAILIKGGGTFPCDARKEAFDNITRKQFVITSAPIQDNYTVICTSRERAVSFCYLYIPRESGECRVVRV